MFLDLGFFPVKVSEKNLLMTSVVEQKTKRKKAHIYSIDNNGLNPISFYVLGWLSTETITFSMPTT